MPLRQHGQGKALDTSARMGVDDEEAGAAIRQCLVAAPRIGQRGAAFLRRVGAGQVQEPIPHRRCPTGRRAETGERARKDNKHRLLTAQQQVEAVTFHRCVEAARDGNTSIAQRAGKVIGNEDGERRGTAGDEESEVRCPAGARATGLN